VVEGQLHAGRGAAPAGRGGGDVVGVGVAAVAQHFAVDAGAPGQRPVEPFQHEEGGALAHDEAVAVDVEGPGGGGRVVVAARQRPHAGEGGDGDGGDHGLGAAGQHDVGGVVADQPGALADGVGAGRAGGGHADVGARPAELHGHDGRGG